LHNNALILFFEKRYGGVLMLVLAHRYRYGWICRVLPLGELRDLVLTTKFDYVKLRKVKQIPEDLIEAIRKNFGRDIRSAFILNQYNRLGYTEYWIVELI